jgi:hypothetical protein
MFCGRRKCPVSKYVVSGLVAAAVSSVVCLDARAVSTNVSWIAGSGSWSGPGNWSPAGVPVPGSTVNIVHNDSSNRLITFDYSYSDPLARFVVDQTGMGTTTFSMSSGTIGTRYVTSDEQMLIGLAGKGTMLQSGGVNTGLGSNSFFYQVHLGENAGSAGTYNLSGGTLSCAGLLVGVAGAGTFIQSAGLASADFGYIATNNGSFGRFDLSGSGSFVGHNFFAGQGGTCLINQTGGTWQGSQLTMAFNNGVGTFNLSNGTTSIAQFFIGGGGTGAFNQTGGVASVNNLWLGGGTIGGREMEHHQRIAHDQQRGRYRQQRRWHRNPQHRIAGERFGALSFRRIGDRIQRHHLTDQWNPHILRRKHRLCRNRNLPAQWRNSYGSAAVHRR